MFSNLLALKYTFSAPAFQHKKKQVEKLGDWDWISEKEKKQLLDQHIKGQLVWHSLAFYVFSPRQRLSAEEVKQKNIPAH